MNGEISCSLCGAQLSVEEDWSVVRCPFCGEINECPAQEDGDLDDGLPFPPLPGFGKERWGNGETSPAGVGTKRSGAYPGRKGRSHGRHRTEDGQILDSWEEIFEATRCGRHREWYRVGDMKLLDLGPGGKVHMQIVGFDADERADGKGMAPITWLSVELVRGRWGMNYQARRVEFAGKTCYDSGTGSVGGWQGSVLRKVMQECMDRDRANQMLVLPGVVKEHILKVKKQQPAWALHVDYFTNDRDMVDYMQTSEDRLWIPSYREVMSAAGAYAALYRDERRLVKRTAGTDTAHGWWLRSSVDCEQYYGITADGLPCACPTENCRGVVLGFCTE